MMELPVALAAGGATGAGDPDAPGLRWLLELGLILAAVKLAGHLSVRIGQPSIFGKLLVGVLLGPALLGWVVPSPLLEALAELGVILLMFLAGVETELEEFKKAGVPATLAAVGGVVVPFVGGALVARAYGYDLPRSLFIGTLLVATSVSISVLTLRELGRLRTREGATLLGAAVLDDVLGLIVLSLVLGLAEGEAGALGALLARIALFFAAAVAAGRWVLVPAVRLAGRLRVSHPVLTAGMAGALAFAYLAEALGLAGIVGSYLAGLLLSGQRETREALVHGVEQVSFSFFVPVFFASIGLHADLRGFTAAFLAFTLLLTLVAIAGKVVGAGAGAWLSRFPSREALAVGVGMVARGEVGLIVATIGLERGLIDARVFTAMVVVVLATTLVTPPLLKAVLGTAPAPTPLAAERAPGTG